MSLAPVRPAAPAMFNRPSFKVFRREGAFKKYETRSQTRFKTVAYFFCGGSDFSW